MVATPYRLRVVVVLSALALAAGLLALALLAKPTQAQAQTDTFNERLPVTFILFNPCTEETVFIEGTTHLVIHATEDANGGFLLKIHSDFQGEGVGEDSGATYVVRSSANDHRRVSSESASNFTFTQNFEFIRRGSPTPDDDLLARIRSRVTINANGEVTSELEYVEEVECK